MKERTVGICSNEIEKEAELVFESEIEEKKVEIDIDINEEVVIKVKWMKN